MPSCSLAVPYLLAKYVFPMLQLAGWVGLREAELLEKARPYSVEPSCAPTGGGSRWRMCVPARRTGAA